MVLEDGCVTVICDVDCSVPAACALARIVCTAAITSACWLADACPRLDVHERLCARLSKTEGNCVSALTLGSQDCWSTACASAVPVRLLFCASQSSAYATWSGFVAAARTCAT